MSRHCDNCNDDLIGIREAVVREQANYFSPVNHLGTLDLCNECAGSIVAKDWEGLIEAEKRATPTEDE